jgi:hypothetical protein
MVTISRPGSKEPMQLCSAGAPFGKAQRDAGEPRAARRYGGPLAVVSPVLLGREATQQHGGRDEGLRLLALRRGAEAERERRARLRVALAPRSRCPGARPSPRRKKEGFHPRALTLKIIAIDDGPPGAFFTAEGEARSQRCVILDVSRTNTVDFARTDGENVSRETFLPSVCGEVLRPCAIDRKLLLRIPAPSGSRKVLT